MRPKVSIITRTFNHEVYIKESITSVLNQTFTDWELIIVDDASADKTIEIISRFQKRDKRIHTIFHKKRWGSTRAAYTYNEALAQAKGELIALLDGDDFWPSRKLEIQITTFKHKNIVLSFGDYILVDRESKPFALYAYNQNWQFLQNKPVGNILNLFGNLNFHLMAVTVMMRKSSLVAIGGFQKDKLFPFEDLPTWLHMSLQGEFFYSREILGVYRKQPESIWFQKAHVNRSLFRKETQSCFWHFVKKNSGILQKNGISIDEKLPSIQKRSIEDKIQDKRLSDMKHYLVFRETDKLNREYSAILSSKHSSFKEKLMTNLLWLINRCYKPIRTVSFRTQLIWYKLSLIFR